MKTRRKLACNLLKIVPRIGVIFTLLLGSVSVNAGDKPPLPSTEQMGLFMNSTTCVVLEDASVSYNI